MPDEYRGLIFGALASTLSFRRSDIDPFEPLQVPVVGSFCDSQHDWGEAGKRGAAASWVKFKGNKILSYRFTRRKGGKKFSYLPLPYFILAVFSVDLNL